MSTTRRRHPSKRKQVSLATVLVQGLRRLFIARVGWYVPALTPIFLFVLAHLLSLITFVLVHHDVEATQQPVYASLVTWTVYGIIPLLLCSYVCFFLVARPLIGFLFARLPHWSDSSLHLLNSCIYGTVVGLALLGLLTPGLGAKMVLLFLVGFAGGFGNWQIYRRLVVFAPRVVPSQEPDLNEVDQE